MAMPEGGGGADAAGSRGPRDRVVLPRTPGTPSPAAADHPGAMPTGGGRQRALHRGRPRLWLATGNVHKAEELRRLVQAALGARGQALDIADLRALPGYRAPVEDGADYADIALLKARAVAAVVPAGDAVLADDSGIEVAALDGEPGVRSNRWTVAPDGSALDASGLNAALLRRLLDVRGAARAAQMVCKLSLLLPEAEAMQTVCGHGVLLGRIADEARGDGGFGYDAVFLLTDGRRLAEVGPRIKDRLGHRGQAVQSVARALSEWLEHQSAHRDLADDSAMGPAPASASAPPGTAVMRAAPGAFASDRPSANSGAAQSGECPAALVPRLGVPAARPAPGPERVTSGPAPRPACVLELGDRLREGHRGFTEAMAAVESLLPAQALIVHTACFPDELSAVLTGLGFGCERAEREGVWELRCLRRSGRPG